VSVWAAEPLLANPVSFAFDERGRCFVAETYRHSAGVTDTRSHMYWLDDDLACRTVADRVAMFRRAYPGKKPYGDFAENAEQLRLVWDSTGGGKADKSEVFAGGFNRPEDGIAAGVLARKGDVYFTCMPDLYLLQDTKGANKADVKRSLATGFGIHVQFIGHDLHGLRMGPDGRLYFTCADRGLNVTTKEGKHLFYPDTGCVLRCDPDGSNLEVVYVGLRNPQELAFDDHGNLFTWDNNSDSGDRARWVHVVEGGDSGWRCGYQYGTGLHDGSVKQGNRGPWNYEKLWHLQHDGQPAYVLPPLAHFGDGPSGITHYPGVGLGGRYKDHFFCSDFKADPTNSVIWSLAVKPKGASFEVTDLHPFVRGMLPVDCEFGPDGAFYWLDWLGGWNKTGKGRVFRVADPEAMKNPAVAEVKTLLAEGFEKKTVKELAKLLEHPHQQVRQEAQFELVGRRTDGPDEVVTLLAGVAKESKNRLARLHAIWGLGMARAKEWVVIDLATDPDPEVRAQVAKVLGDVAASPDPLKKLLADADPRVQSLAAQSLGKWLASHRDGKPDDPARFRPFLDLLKSNNDADPYLRHAAVNGMARATETPCHLIDAWKAAGPDFDTPPIRLGVVLALRKLNCRRLGEFLSDPDPRVMAEAARAIHDTENMEPMAKLAALADKPNLPVPVALRVLSANLKLGSPENAAAIAKVAARPSEPDLIRTTALKMLAGWADPPRRDAVTGLTQSLPKRPAEVAAAAFKPVIGAMFAGSGAVRQEATQTATKLGIKEVGPTLLEMVQDEKQPPAVRAEALLALDALKDAKLGDAVQLGLAAADGRVRNAARRALAPTKPDEVVTQVADLLAKDGDLREQQGAVAVLAAVGNGKADAVLRGLMDRALAKQLPAGLHLDVLDAAAKRGLKAELAKYDAARPKDDTLAPWRETLTGGDADAGRQVFLNNAAVYCQRCHKLAGEGGEVGPPLDGIGAKQSREYLLESVTLPDKQVAQGYESVTLVLLNGKSVSGVLRSEDASEIKLVTPEGQAVAVKVADVDERRKSKSAMPEDLASKLSKAELRDLVEFLASLKEPAKK
jgi:quinoprotein glucose dehydrogenase